MQVFQIIQILAPKYFVTLVRLQQKRWVFQVIQILAPKYFVTLDRLQQKRRVFFIQILAPKYFVTFVRLQQRKCGFFNLFKFWRKMFCVTSRSGWQKRLTQYGCRSVAGVDRWTACSRCFSFVPGFASASIEQEHNCHCLKKEYCTKLYTIHLEKILVFFNKQERITAHYIYGELCEHLHIRNTKVCRNTYKVTLFTIKKTSC